jgi:hypothetical protein
MNKKWAYFLAAAVFAGYFLVTKGAPPLAVALGIAAAALLARRTSPSL